MNSNFIAQKAEPCGPALVSAMIGVFDTGKDAALILPGLRGGQLFAYLFRRFGYPNSGWDDHKELVYYLLTTPMDNVFLAVRPHMGGDYADNRPQSRVHLMFGYCISQEIEDQLYAIPASKHSESEIYQRVSSALKATIRDLQRPVYVRDVPINCYGRVPDEEETEFEDAAERAAEAGYGIPAALLVDIDRYDKFLDAMAILGSGDFGKGMQWVIEQAARNR